MRGVELPSFDTIEEVKFLLSGQDGTLPDCVVYQPSLLITSIFPRKSFILYPPWKSPAIYFFANSSSLSTFISACQYFVPPSWSRSWSLLIVINTVSEGCSCKNSAVVCRTSFTKVVLKMLLP